MSKEDELDDLEELALQVSQLVPLLDLFLVFSNVSSHVCNFS